MYMVEIDDRVHEDVVVSGDNLMGCVEDALSEWMDANGEDLTARTEATMSVYVDGKWTKRVRLSVEDTGDTAWDGEPLYDLVLGSSARAALEGL